MMARPRTEDRIILDHVTLDSEDFSKIRPTQFTVIASVLRRCSFERAKLEQPGFGEGTRTSEYIECSFDGARIRAHAPGAARFVRCTFENVVIRDFLGLKTEFVDCVFSGKIQGVVFDASLFEDWQAMLGRAKNEFRGNDFSRATLVDIAFRGGIDLTQQRLPSGPGYLYLPDAEPVLTQVRSLVIGWKDLELRRSALAVLKVMLDEVDKGQRQIFCDTGTSALPRDMRAGASLVYDELRQAKGAE